MRGLIDQSGTPMSDHDSHSPQALDGHYEGQPATEDEKADAFAALVVIVVGILTAIHFVYTGGLPAFLEHVF